MTHVEMCEMMYVLTHMFLHKKLTDAHVHIGDDVLRLVQRTHIHP